MSFGYASNSNLRGAQRGAALTTATSSFVGVVRVDGSSMLVDANGTISVDPTALNNLSSIAATKATTSTFGIVRADGTSIAISGGLISIATSSNGFGVRTVQSTSAGVPTGGSSGDIVYQY